MTLVSSSLTIWLPEIVHAVAALLDSFATGWFHEQHQMRTVLDVMALSTVSGFVYRTLVGLSKIIVRFDLCRLIMLQRATSALFSALRTIKGKLRNVLCWLRDKIEWIIMTLD